MIEIEGLSKRYKVYKRRADRFREWMAFGQKNLHHEFWALRDVSLRVDKGRVLGIIGMNGAGKSTLLKILSGTSSATTGSVRIDGRVAALLVLGTGFHHELTGRDNVLINGKLLGLSAAEIAARIEDIKAFS